MAEKHMKLVTRQQPHIETLQVSVQVVRIGPKQMTLAVFRQLQNDPLVDPKTLELRGVPWGTVQYTPGDCPQEIDYHGHLHVVWQCGDALRRCCFPRGYPRPEERTVYRQAMHCLSQLGIRVMDYSGRTSTDLSVAWMRSALQRVSLQDKPTLLSPGKIETLQEAEQMIDLVDYWQRRFPALQARWREHVEEIEALPQLFIAV